MNPDEHLPELRHALEGATILSVEYSSRIPGLTLALLDREGLRQEVRLEGTFTVELSRRKAR